MSAPADVEWAAYLAGWRDAEDGWIDSEDVVRACFDEWRAGGAS